MNRAPVYLVTGDDTTLVSDAVITLVRELVGTGDRSLMVEELDEDSYRTDDGFDLARLLDAAQTPPFLTERRVVVSRHAGRFGKADEWAGFIAYLADPLPTTHVVLVWEKGESPRQDRLAALPKKLGEAIVACGGQTVATDIPSGKNAQVWLQERMAESGVRLDRGAQALIAERLGEDRSRVLGLLNVLESTFGGGRALGVDDVTPYLGGAGSVPPWELTDAIDRGDVVGALDRLARMMGAGERHPMQIISTLHTHFSRMLRLDGLPGLDEKAAASRLGLRGSTFPAKKALLQTRKLGSAKVQQAIVLLGEADLALRGTVAWPPELVMEVLVARLARLSAR